MLGRAFFERSTVKVARDLVGCFLVHELKRRQLRGRIVETEAYMGPNDAASHAHRGLTTRNALMFGRAGYAYVYLIYGMYHCLNVVTQREGYPAAVLIRALEPVDGSGGCNGPGRLTRAFGIDKKEHNGMDMTRPPLFFEPREGRAPTILPTPRIHVAYAGDWALRPWRFVDLHSDQVSVPVPKRLRKPAPRRTQNTR